MPETVTIAFPDTFVQWGQKSILRSQTDILEAQGREQRRPRLPGIGRRLLSGDLQVQDMTGRARVGNFIQRLRGSYIPFYIFEWDPQPFLNNSYGSMRLGAANLGPNYLIGPGDAVASLFTLPMGNPTGYRGAATALYAAYSNGIEYPATLSVGAGTFGEDKLQFSIPSGVPTNFPLAGGGSLSAGNYSILWTNIIATPDGYAESFASVAATPVACAAGDRLAVNIFTGPTGTAARNIYRTVANGSVYKLDTNIPNNTTTSLSVSQADGTLGITAPTHVPPLNAVIECDITGRLRIPVRLMADDVAEAFVVSANILGIRHLDVIEVL